jgi:hypothetical protein
MPDDPTPDEPTQGEQPPSVPGADEAPTVEAEPPTAADPAPEPAVAPAPATAPASARAREPLTWSTGRVAAIVLLVLVLAAGAGFLVGRSTSDSGPDSLAAAVKETANGDLPRGDLSLGDAIGALGPGSGSGSGKAGNLGGLLGGLLGGRDKNGSGKAGGATSEYLQQLLNRLEQQLGGSGGSGSGSGSGSEITPGTGTAFFGISAQPAPSGQAGAQIAAVADSSPASDAGLKVGDVVTAVDGNAVTTPAELVTAVRSHQPGDPITVTYTRDGHSTDVKVRLANSSSATTPPPTPTTPPTTRAA